MAVAEDVRRRTEPAPLVPLVSDKQENNAHAHLPSSAQTSHKQTKGRGRDKKGDRIQRRHFIRERMDLGSESAPKSVELFHASIIGLAAVDTEPDPSHSNRVQYV